MVSEMKRNLMKSPIPVGLCLCLCLIRAQAQNLPASITVNVVGGEGITTRTQQRVGRDAVVRVEDDAHNPIPGAVVVFALPLSGTSGEFTNGSRNLTVVADSNGLAAARGLKTNDVPGRLQIYVSASYRSLRARTLINQTVEGAPGARPRAVEVHSKSGGKWKWVVLVLAAGAGSGAGYYLSNRPTAAALPSPISVTTGTVTFGSPR
jgi:hypothetical protein